MPENRNPRYDLFAVILLVVIVFLSASLLSYDAADPVGTLFSPLDQFYQPDQLVWPVNAEPQNACGYWGAFVSDMLLATLGIGAIFLVIGLAAVAVALLQRQTVHSLWTKTLGWLCTLVGLTTLANMVLPTASLGPITGPGGYLGALGSGLLELHFAQTGGLILAISVTAIGLFMWTEYAFIRVFGFVLGSLLAVLAFVFPSNISQAIGTLRQSLAARRENHSEDERWIRGDQSHADNDEPQDQEDELDEDDEELEEYEEDAEDVEDEWDEEWDEEQDPDTIPFVVKTAAKTTTIKKQSSIAEDQGPGEPQADPRESRVPKRPHFRFGRKRKPSQPVETEETPTPPPKPPSEREQVISALNQAANVDNTPDYDLPDLDLLTEANEIPATELKNQTIRQGRRLEKKFLEFGHKVKVVDVETGPVITQYELELEAGLRLSKITSLADDIAIGLRVPSVRIVAPIPGKNTVGIEVPNESRQTVHLKDVMVQSTAVTRKMKIPLFLGQDVSGNTLVADLSKLPHLLIAGRTGTGKSVCLNAIISSILMTRRPDEVRMLMIDPKMVELSGYGRLPHLMHPVVTDMRKAEAILAWAVDKMEDRYKLLARAGVRHINSYNQLGEEELMDRLQPESEEEKQELPRSLPFIVIVADEMADLMMTAGKEVEQHIIRLAQKSRAVGIHLILATQKPTVDVITGLIKSNLPARISFQVASQNDSRVVLDANGAEKLLGNGDMLFLWPGTSTLIRGQGTFLSDDEIDAITDSVSTGEQNFVNELVNIKVTDDHDDELAGKLKNRDELYNQAVEVVIRENRGSVSLLQRSLGIGYGRAARLVDFMEEDGIVGPYAGSKSREIIMTMEQWHRLQSGETIDTTEDSAGQTATRTAAPVSVSTPGKHPNRENPPRIPPSRRQRSEDSNAIPPLARNLVVTSDEIDVDAEDHDDLIEPATIDFSTASRSLKNRSLNDQWELDSDDTGYGDNDLEDDDLEDDDLGDDDDENLAYEDDGPSNDDPSHASADAESIDEAWSYGDDEDDEYGDEEDDEEFEDDEDGEDGDQFEYEYESDSDPAPEDENDEESVDEEEEEEYEYEYEHEHDVENELEDADEEDDEDADEDEEDELEEDDDQWEYEYVEVDDDDDSQYEEEEWE